MKHTDAIEGTFTKLPHELALDLRLSAGAVRLYAVIDALRWKRAPITRETLAEAMAVHPATIYRWLAELREAGYPVQIRTDANSFRTDAKPIRTYANDFRTDANSFRTDAKPRADIGHANAPKHAPKILLDHEDPPPPDQGGGGVAIAPGRSDHPNRVCAQPPEGARLLAHEGFSSAACVEFGHLPAALLQEEISRRRAMGQGPGAMVKAWRMAPPGSNAPQVAPAPRVTETEIIRSGIGPEELHVWLHRFRDAPPADRPGVLERFRREHPRPPAREAAWTD